MATLSTYQEIPVNKIRTNKNYRQTFNEQKLKELAASIKLHGVIEPLIVRQPKGTLFFEVIAGERRLRASKMAGLVTVPCIVKDISDGLVLETQLVENMQREGVQYMEEAYGLKQLRDECDLDAAEIAKKVSKSESYVYMMLKLTDMVETAQVACQRGEISKTVAFMISKMPDHEQQAKAAVDLRRGQADKLIGERSARRYFEDQFGDARPAAHRRAPSVARHSPNGDYAANWKRHLLTFNAPQFERFKTLANGRVSVEVLAGAVEKVMLEQI